MRDLAPMFEPVIESMGYELVGVEFVGGGGHGTLRVYIDSERGITVDDCAAISHQVSGILDVEEPIKQPYDLEVSSPGLDRPLFKAADYARFSGCLARIKLIAPRDNRRNFRGELRGIDDAGRVEIEVDGELFHLPIGEIARANLVGDVDA